MKLLRTMLQVGEHNKHGRVLKAEKLAARETIYPILQAEEDRRQAHPASLCLQAHTYASERIVLMHVSALTDSFQGTKACPLTDHGMQSSLASYDVCHPQICAS